MNPALAHDPGVTSDATVAGAPGAMLVIVSGPSGVGLPPQYSLFGQFVKGLDVLDTMQRVKTGAGDRPVEDVVINSVTITESD